MKTLVLISPNLSFTLSGLFFSTSISKSTVRMLHLDFFRAEKGNDPEIIRESQGRRFADATLVDQIVHLDKQWREMQFDLEQCKKDFNKRNKEIAKSKIGKQDASELIKKSEVLGMEIAQNEVEVKAAKKELDERLTLVGNLVHDSVPVDNDVANNSVVRTWGECRPKGKLINHVDLVKKVQIADLEKGSKVAGGRCCYLKQTGAFLEMALLDFGLSFLRERNYEPLPTLSSMRKEIMARCALPSRFDKELYKVAGDVGDGDEKGGANEKYLIASPEQSLCALHTDEHLYPQSLPMRYVGLSPCFHKDGSHGRDTLDFFSSNQFEKMVQFCITSPNDNKSWEMHEEMLTNAEDFHKELGLPYRVVNIVSGALNHAAAKTYALEAWFPASETFRELVSCSNCTDFQARNLGIAYGLKKNDKQTKQFVHLLNCTLTATPRTICCILENYQKEDGVVVPEVLRPFMLGSSSDFIPFKN